MKQKTAKWIKEKDSKVWFKCENCGNYGYANNYIYPNDNYCSNCGAKMKPKEEPKIIYIN